MEKKHGVKLANHLRDLAVPLISVATFFPILIAYLASSQPETPEIRSTLPRTVPVSEKPLVTEAPKAAPPAPRVSPPEPRPKTEVKPVKSVPSAPVRKVERQPRQPLVVPANYTPPPLEIRVAIERDLPNTTIGVSGQAIVTDRDNRALKTIRAEQGLQVTPVEGGIRMGEYSLPAMVFIRPTREDGLVYVNDRWYRGRMLLVSRGDSLLAVNYVDLESYLYSVVGSEMHPTAPPEALKAQAIAARSYALVHMIRPASPWFHLGNTQRWQVYKGVASEYRSGHEAVNATAGQILSYKGGVVESLYAATDEIVSRAHGGKGMSQTGAYKLADRGYNYQQILANYYPGVGLARLVSQR